MLAHELTQACEKIKISDRFRSFTRNFYVITYVPVILCGSKIIDDETMRTKIKNILLFRTGHMKKIIFLLLATFLLKPVIAQLKNTRWEGAIKGDNPRNTILDFKRHSHSLRRSRQRDSGDNGLYY